MLFKEGVLINLFIDIGVSLFYIVCEVGYSSIVRFLFSNGVEINLSEDIGVCFFYVVCENGYEVII